MNGTVIKFNPPGADGGAQTAIFLFFEGMASFSLSYVE